MEQLGLDFDGDEWDALDDDAEELTLQNLFRTSAVNVKDEKGGDGDDQARWTVSGGRDALLFMIDFRQKMVEEVDETGRPLLSAALQCVADVMKGKIISHDGDLVGVLGFGTAETDNPNSFANISVVRALEPPDAGGIVEMERLAVDAAYTADRYGHLSAGDSFQFHLTLWTCRTLFAQARGIGSSRSRRRVFILTNDDDPSAGSEAQRTQSAVQAKDLADAGAFVEVLCLRRDEEPSASDKFRLDTFFNDVVLQSDRDDAGHALVMLATRFEELRSDVKRREHHKRISDSCALVLGAGAGTLGLRMYSVVKETGKPSTVRLKAKTNEPTRSATSAWCSKTARTLHPSEIGYGYAFLDGTACFSATERLAIKKPFICSTMQVLGFIPEDKVPVDMHLREDPLCHTAYPEEATAIGHRDEVGVKLFTALYDEMCSRRLAMLVFGATKRRGQTGGFGVFMAQEEKRSNDRQVVPPGLRYIVLPFRDDVREDYLGHICGESSLQCPLADRVEASEDQLDAALDLVDKLTTGDFSPNAYYSPNLQKYYAGLQALALDASHDAEVRDDLLPDFDGRTQIAGNEIRDMLKALDAPDGIDVEMNTRKRKDPPDSATVVQRQQEEELAVRQAREFLEREGVDIPQRTRDGTLEETTVMVLKQYCLVNGLPRTGKKRDLIKRISGYVESTE
mmetsp:Transcript_1040/g.3237  ORF Transcript_1040/g.3237 Transcript_1040/m.3237 type:complete len:682 (-) Transcript_1040:862-2907(-)